ncbi:hypothetical protein ACP4OV_012043 [Aristida adscensionis]
MAKYSRFLVQETLVAICLFLSFHPATTSNGSCFAAEKAALLSIKASLFEPDSYLSSWQGEDCCNWKRVKCSEETGHVVKLNLGRNFSDCLNINQYFGSLGGEISHSLVNLQKLRHLDLSCNNLHGAKIPEFLGSMSSLRYLNLSYTLLHGRVPPQVGNLTKLVYLDLKCWSWYNPINIYPFSHDLAWLSQLSSLKHLDMSYVKLSTAVDWVHQINMLPTLKELHLSDSGLRSSVPSLRRFNLTKLEVLDISRNSFGTPIFPNWFWNATSLTYLDMRNCYFYGPIPYEIGKMTSLEQVSFLLNDLMSTMIPSSFRNLCKLTLLDLEDTNTTGDITEIMDRLPNCGSNKVQKLDLDTNNIGGVLPNRPGPLINLTYLIISYNNLTGKIPSWIWALRKLEVLELSANQIDGIVSEDHLNSLADLKFLGLSYTHLQMKIRPDWIPPFKLLAVLLESLPVGPAFPSWLKSQESIELLQISNASITASMPDWFWVVFSRTNYLDLADNQISGTLPSTLEFMAANTMVLSNNRFNGTVPKLPRNIVYIDISKNSLSGTLPPDFGAPLLKVLMLYNNSISGIIPSSVCSLQNLQLLDLSNNMLTGEVPSCKEGMRSLVVVNLNTNSLSGEFPSVFRGSPKTAFLDLSYNQFYGNLPVWLWEEMPSIALLRLRSNMFHGSISSELVMSKELQFLDLAHNNLSGNIPHSLVNMSAMARAFGYSAILARILNFFIFPRLYNARYDTIFFSEKVSVFTKGQQLEYSSELRYMVILDLSCNNLTGEIPRDIGALIALKGFNLSWNRFSGEIPMKIGELKQLESLDLSHNELSGEIPSSMSTLTFLGYMNLSYNELSGKIPTGNPFDTFDASAYVGNIGLCGLPLTEVCPTNASSQCTHGSCHDLDNISSYLAMSIGFVLNNWVVFCVMLFKKSWRDAYFQFVDELHDKIYVFLIIRCARLKSKFGQSL